MITCSMQDIFFWGLFYPVAALGGHNVLKDKFASI